MDPQMQSVDKTRRSADILQAELERKKRDLYRVYNPTNQDFQVIFNAAISPEVWTIEAKQEAIVPNYVRIKYLEEMTDKIIINKSDKLVLEENEKREARGFSKMDLHTEQFRLESKNLKILMGKRDQITKVLDRGLYKEYGVERMDQQIDRREQREAFDPGDVFAQAEKPVAPPPPPPAQPVTEAAPVDTAQVIEEPDETIESEKEALSDN